MNPTLSLDAARRKARLGDREIALTRNETRLLGRLLLEPGAVVGHEELSRAIWPWEEEPRPPLNVRVEICRVRRKLGSESIENIKGEGYRVRLSRTCPSCGCRVHPPARDEAKQEEGQ